MAKALSHPARVAIVRFLYDRGEVDYATLADRLPLSQATVSQHLKVLREAGFIRGVAEGKQMTYRINRRAVRTLEKGIRHLTDKKRGVLSKGRLPGKAGGRVGSWWEEIPLGLRTGPYYASQYISGVG